MTKQIPCTFSDLVSQREDLQERREKTADLRAAIAQPLAYNGTAAMLTSAKTVVPANSLDAAAALAVAAASSKVRRYGDMGRVSTLGDGLEGINTPLGLVTWQNVGGAAAGGAGRAASRSAHPSAGGRPELAVAAGAGGTEAGLGSSGAGNALSGMRSPMRPSSAFPRVEGAGGLAGPGMRNTAALAASGGGTGRWDMKRVHAASEALRTSSHVGRIFIEGAMASDTFLTQG